MTNEIAPREAAALELLSDARAAFNLQPRFRTPGLYRDSYEIAAAITRALAYPQPEQVDGILREVLSALNTAPRFKIGLPHQDSYALAAAITRHFATQ